MTNIALLISAAFDGEEIAGTAFSMTSDVADVHTRLQQDMPFNYLKRLDLLAAGLVTLLKEMYGDDEGKVAGALSAFRKHTDMFLKKYDCHTKFLMPEGPNKN